MNTFADDQGIPGRQAGDDEATSPRRRAPLPFLDGYDIEAERLALADLIEADEIDTLDPRYGRFAELEQRERALHDQSALHRARGGAASEVGLQEALDLKNLGGLRDDDDDSMMLHTRDASRLFIGRSLVTGERGYSEPGAKQVGAALRSLWLLSNNNNPYADLVLIEATASLNALVQRLEQNIARLQAQMDRLRSRGLSFFLVRAEPPARVKLEFRSPYGYTIVRLVSAFDFHARVVKTLVRKDMLSEEEGYQLIYAFVRTSRRLFDRVIRVQRLLLRDEMRPLTRADWLPGAGEQASKRVRAAVALLGELPREVFNGSQRPRHGGLPPPVLARELRLLNAVALGGEPAGSTAGPVGTKGPPSPGDAADGLLPQAGGVGLSLARSRGGGVTLPEVAVAASAVAPGGVAGLVGKVPPEAVDGGGLLPQRGGEALSLLRGGAGEGGGEGVVLAQGVAGGGVPLALADAGAGEGRMAGAGGEARAGDGGAPVRRGTTAGEGGLRNAEGLS